MSVPKRMLAIIAMIGCFCWQDTGSAQPSADSRLEVPQPTDDALRAAINPGPEVRSSKRLNFMRNLEGSLLTSLSDAELVALIDRALRTDQDELQLFTDELDNPENPYVRAENAFNTAEEHLADAQSRLTQALEAEQDSLAERLRQEVDVLESIRGLLRERFDLAIERRQLINGVIPILKNRIAKLNLVLVRTLGDRELSSETLGRLDPTLARELEATPTVTDELADAADTGDGELLSEHFTLAEGEASKWEATVAEVKHSVALLQSLLATTDELLKIEMQLNANCRSAFDNLAATRLQLSQRLQRQSIADSFREALQGEFQKSEQLTNDSRDKARDTSDRVAGLNLERGYILEALATRKMDVELAKTNLANAKKEVARILNPLHPNNILRWLIDHGLNILAILLVTLVLFLLVQRIGSHGVKLLASRGLHGSKEERLSRATTLVSAFRQAANLALLAGTVLMILDEAGIPIVPLLGGAAVFGLAVAFGAQNLIKDFFQGFMILLENQYKLNDFIKVGNHAGLVEQITLRTTVLRGLDGALQFVPNGQINAVSNLTHGWSRALLDVPISYRSDVDLALAIVREICEDLAADSRFSHLVLDEPTILGVEELAESAVILRFFVKTVPLQQWTIRRELLYRIKKRFDAEGVEIPFPHRTVFFRNEGPMLPPIAESNQ